MYKKNNGLTKLNNYFFVLIQINSLILIVIGVFFVSVIGFPVSFLNKKLNLYLLVGELSVFEIQKDIYISQKDLLSDIFGLRIFFLKYNVPSKYAPSYIFGNWYQRKI